MYSLFLFQLKGNLLGICYLQLNVHGMYGTGKPHVPTHPDTQWTNIISTLFVNQKVKPSSFQQLTNGKSGLLVLQIKEIHRQDIKKKPSAFEGNQVDQYPPSVPTESQADVIAKGIWNDGKWTLEMLREMNTGYDDDANLSTKKLYDIAIAVFDHEEHAKHNSSKIIKMRFESAE